MAPEGLGRLVQKAGAAERWWLEWAVCLAITAQSTLPSTKHCQAAIGGLPALPEAPEGVPRDKGVGCAAGEERAPPPGTQQRRQSRITPTILESKSREVGGRATARRRRCLGGGGGGAQWREGWLLPSWHLFWHERVAGASMWPIEQLAGSTILGGRQDPAGPARLPKRPAGGLAIPHHPAMLECLRQGA